MASEDFDVIIVGAGLSGVGAAYHLQSKLPGKKYVVLEGRASMGGTWDLFRYPGIRSDSDMYTLGYSFRPWRDGRAIADGPSILRYLRDRWANRLMQNPKIRMNTSLDPAQSCAIGNVQIVGMPTGRVVTDLWDKWRIIATPIVHPEFEGVRVTPNVYTTLAEIDTFAAAMEELAAKRPA